MSGRNDETQDSNPLPLSKRKTNDTDSFSAAGDNIRSDNYHDLSDKLSLPVELLYAVICQTKFL